MRVARLRRLAVLALLGTGCESAVDPPGFDQGRRLDGWTPDSTAVVAHESNSGFTSASRMIIADSASWQAAWAQIYLTVLPVPAAPRIDFTTERVLVVSYGARGGAGYAIQLDSLVTFELGTTAFVTRRRPGQYCGSGSATTAPVHAVRVPARTAVRDWVESDRVFDCGP